LDHPSALLIGDPGLGKTMLASAVVHEFQKRNVELKRKDLPEDVRIPLAQERWPVFFVQLAEFIEMHFRLLRSSPTEE
jgi:DNA replication protein DnaC